MSDWLTSVINESEAKGVKKGLAQGVAQGRILESVEIYRNEMNMDNESIIRTICKKFNLAPEKAKEYVLPPKSDSTFS